MAIRIGGILYSSQEWYDEHITGKGKQAVGGVEVPIEQPKAPPTVGGVQEGINDVQGLIDQGIEPPQQDEPPIGDDLGTFSMPKDTETPTPDTTDLDAFYAGEQERAKQEAERQAKIDEEERKQLEERKEEQQNWWDRMMGKETIEEKEASALEETGVDVSEHFKRLDADLAEMDSMRDSFKAKMAERDMALAGVEGVGMPQGWMNDRKIVITNKYNAELRLMAANMDSMAASMEAREGRYDKALQFADRAVDNYTKDLQIEWQRYNEFADENEDLLRDLGKEYEEFVQAERDAKYNQLVEQDRIKREVMELDRKSNGQTNININDTLQEANEKYVRWLSEQPEEVTDFTNTQKLALEQAGLGFANRQQQLNYLSTQGLLGGSDAGSAVFRARGDKAARFMEARVGRDGKISSKTYHEAHKLWNDLGGNDNDWTLYFPPEEVMNPDEIQRLYKLYPSIYKAPSGGTITAEGIVGKEGE